MRIDYDKLALCKNSAVMRTALAALLAFASIGTVSAEPGRCLLEVKGKPYLLGPCNVERDKDGSFTLGTGSPKIASEYFAYLSVEDDGTAFAHWNGEGKYRKADEPLGKLTKLGACWVSAEAKVCAWSRK